MENHWRAFKHWFESIRSIFQENDSGIGEEVGLERTELDLETGGYYKVGEKNKKGVNQVHKDRKEKTESRVTEEEIQSESRVRWHLKKGLENQVQSYAETVTFRCIYIKESTEK